MWDVPSGNEAPEILQLIQSVFEVVDAEDGELIADENVIFADFDLSEANCIINL